MEAFLTYMGSGGATERTRRTRRNQLMLLARSVDVEDPWSVTFTDLAAFLGRPSWGKATRNAHRSAVRGFYRWAVESGRMPGPSPALLLPTTPTPAPRARPTPQLVVEQALAAAEPRVQLMIRLAVEMGMRRAEVAQVHARDVVEDVDGWSLVVHGKGEKDRMVPMPDDLADLVADRAAGGWLFNAQRGDGHLSERRVGDVVSAALPGHWTMHSLRHRFATRAYAGASDLYAVQELLGHNSPATTRMYVQVGYDRLRAALMAAAPVPCS